MREKYKDMDGGLSNHVAIFTALYWVVVGNEHVVLHANQSTTQLLLNPASYLKWTFQANYDPQSVHMS